MVSATGASAVDNLDTYALFAQFWSEMGRQEIQEDDQNDIASDQKDQQGIHNFSASGAAYARKLGVDRQLLLRYKTLLRQLYGRDFNMPATKGNTGSIEYFMRLAQATDELGRAIANSQGVGAHHISEGFQALGKSYSSIMDELDFHLAEITRQKEKVLHESHGNVGIPFREEATGFGFPWARTLIRLLDEMYKGAVTSTIGKDPEQSKENLRTLSIQVAEYAIDGISPEGARHSSLFRSFLKRMDKSTKDLAAIVSQTYKAYEDRAALRQHSDTINDEVGGEVSNLALLATPYQGPFILRAMVESRKIERVLDQIAIEYREGLTEYRLARQSDDQAVRALKREHAARAQTLTDILEFYERARLKRPEGAVIDPKTRKVITVGGGQKAIASGITESAPGVIVNLYDPTEEIVEQKKGKAYQIVKPEVLIEDLLGVASKEIVRRQDHEAGRDYSELMVKIASREADLSPAGQLTEKALRHYASAISHFTSMQAFIGSVQQKLLAMSEFYTIFAGAISDFSTSKTESRDVGREVDEEEVRRNLEQAKEAMMQTLVTADQNIDDIYTNKGMKEQYLIDSMTQVRRAMYRPLLERARMASGLLNSPKSEK